MEIKIYYYLITLLCEINARAMCKEFCNRGRGLSAAIEETASHSSITNFLSHVPKGKRRAVIGKLLVYCKRLSSKILRRLNKKQ